MEKGPISNFITHHYRHFNSAALVDAAKAYDEHMNKGGKSSTFDTSKNQMMGSLAKTLTGCIKGCPQQVATDNGAEISEAETAEGYVVTLTAGAGAKRGYSKIVLVYRKSDCVLTKMTMEEVSGIATVYEMKGIKKNTSFPEDVFRVPGK